MARDAAEDSSEPPHRVDPRSDRVEECRFGGDETVQAQEASTLRPASSPGPS